MHGRVELTKYRARPDLDPAVDERMAASPMFTGDEPQAFANFWIQCFVKTDLFGYGILAFGQTIELDYVFEPFFAEPPSFGRASLSRSANRYPSGGARSSRSSQFAPSSAIHCAASASGAAANEYRTSRPSRGGDEPGAAQHLEVLHYRLPADRQGLRQLGRGDRLCAGDLTEHRAARRVRQRGEHRTDVIVARAHATPWRASPRARVSWTRTVDPPAPCSSTAIVTVLADAGVGLGPPRERQLGAVARRGAPSAAGPRRRVTGSAARRRDAG